MLFLRVLQEAAHWAAAIPLAVCLYLCLRNRNPMPDAWLLACAFFVSWIADNALKITAASGNNWWLVYLYVPIQFALFIGLLTQARALRTVGIGALALLAVLSVSRGTLDRPETFVQVAGGAMVGLLAWQHSTIGKYRSALLVYCVAAIPSVILMGAIEPPPRPEWGLWMFAWAAYQLVRITAMALMVSALIRQPYLRLMEADDGPGAGKTVTRRRYPYGLSHSDTRRPLPET